MLGALLLLALLGLPGGLVAAQSPAPDGSGGAGASPSATDGVIGSGDPRSEGEGPGLVGSPEVIALGVVGLGLLAAGATALYVRLTRDD
jgi:hypothetical protein